MVINNVLDKLFSTRSNIVVLRALENYAVGISGREAARITGLTPKNCLITLTALEQLGVVIRVRGGREHLFSLNRDHFLVREVILPVLVSEKRFFESLLNEIRKSLKKYSISVFLFGSVARNEETIESDMDLCIVYQNVTSKSRIEEVVSELGIKLNKKFGVSLAPFYISKSEFISRAKSKKSPIVDVINDGKHLCGDKIEELLNG
ncbi:MAG: nucleotidyltransferase domain-containing protein [Ignavibacteriaceae bacterium]|nr:nucleotidyltransferase domain-containing protein [Ignavibacteriaceae bacterium]